jgi:hypothetical protein
MRVRPNAEQIALAEENGVIWQDKLTLKDFVKQCERRGITRNHLQDAGTIELYHFDEQKSLEATVNTDFHYFRISQYLRLSRRAISLAGLELISVTPGSRLHDYFPNITVEQACELIMQDVGNPGLEHTRGLYSQQISRDYSTTCTMQDFPPHRQNHSHKQIKEVPAKPQMKPGPENSASQYNDEAEITIHVNKHKSSRFGQWCKQQIKAEST